MRLALGATALTALASVASAYPLDGYAATGIRRLEGYRLAAQGEATPAIRQPPGAWLETEQIRLRLAHANPSFEVEESTPRDPHLQNGLERIFAGRDPSYSIALLDITDPAQPRFAALRADVKRIPGSLGKLLVAGGLLDAVKLRFHADLDGRGKFLRETVVAADSFVHRDGKTVPFYEIGGETIRNRRIETGDRFNLYEWLDHMLSPSSNAAGSTVWKEALLLRRFGDDYPLPAEAEKDFLAETPKDELQRLALETLESPLRAAGLNPDNLRLGTFFTRNASAVIPGSASEASPLELLRWLIRLEQGRIVDRWSSLELKKLLYFTRPRYRYASSPALSDAAVFFKSGSLFQCVEESGFVCKAYAGNKLNLMHSVAIVESGEKVYLLAMTSNVLRVNGAVEHQGVAGEIERLIQNRPAD